MDNNYTDELFKNDKKADQNIINTNNVKEDVQNINNINMSNDGFENLNFNAEREANDKFMKRYKEQVMMGDIKDYSIFEVKEEDTKLKKTLEGYLPVIIADNYRLIGKSPVDKIPEIEPVQSNYSFSIKGMVAKGKDAWHTHKLKKEYSKTYNDDSPEIDSTSYKLRKSTQTYNEENKDEIEEAKEYENQSHLSDEEFSYESSLIKDNDKAKEKDKKKTNFNALLKSSMSFYFKSALCNETYMVTHYADLRKNVDQCIILPEMMKRDGKYWSTLSQDMKDMIDLQAKTAKCFKALFIAFGKRHHIDVMTGEFYPEGLSEKEYRDYKLEYKMILKDNYKYLYKLKEKNNFASSNEIEALLKKISIGNLDE
ncbi:MAG: hypothetical protein IJV15_08110 [Lachnospiraceae bacterium]|nr:hypothetical protein [Lachnospiraceae bacterium]